MLCGVTRDATAAAVVAGLFALVTVYFLFCVVVDTDCFRPGAGLGMGVSRGNNPKSMEIATALGMESQLLPFGAIHLRRFRFCQK